MTLEQAIRSLQLQSRRPAEILIGALLAYLAVAVGGAIFFVRASRIAVGLDGIYISGSARARFVPYSEIDRVELAAHLLEPRDDPAHGSGGQDAARGEHLRQRVAELDEMSLDAWGQFIERSDGGEDAAGDEDESDEPEAGPIALALDLTAEPDAAEAGSQQAEPA